MLNEIIKLNEQNKESLLGVAKEYQSISKVRIEKREELGRNYYFLVNKNGKIVLNINVLNDIVSYLKSSGNYITNISFLKTIKEFSYYILTENTWEYIITIIPTDTVYNSFSIIKIDSMKEYARLLLSKRVNILIDSDYYKLIILNERDIILLSSFVFVVSDKTELFFGSLLKVKNIKIENLNTKNVTTMTWLFANNINLETVTLTNFDTTSVIDFTGMFSGCIKLRYITLDTIKTNKASNFAMMFTNCRSLEQLDLNHFNVSNARSFDSMFESCVSLKEIKMDSWDIKTVLSKEQDSYGKGNMWILNTRNMFKDCINLTNINVGVLLPIVTRKGRPKNMANMFANCNTTLIKEIYANSNNKDW